LAIRRFSDAQVATCGSGDFQVTGICNLAQHNAIAEYQWLVVFVHHMRLAKDDEFAGALLSGCAGAPSKDKEENQSLEWHIFASLSLSQNNHK
jgi:hypothetical protein